MAAGIRLADAVHAVSPSYAIEITKPNNLEQGRWGGEGLENDLLEAKENGRLFGILNGSEYPDQPVRKANVRQLVGGLKKTLSGWIESGKGDTEWHQLMLSRLDSQPVANKPDFVLSGVSRLVWQKVGLLQHPVHKESTALDRVLAHLKSTNAVYFFLGSGDPELSGFLKSTARSHPNFIFLEGYNDDAAHLLYRGGDAFLMPSLFEPCGISQMLALRAGQPCVVHNVGGLKDTITDGQTGFVFGGDSLTDISESMVAAIARAVSIKASEEKLWQRMREEARKSRFLWESTVRRYAHDLYRIQEDPAAV
jgi:starch synthase